MSEYIKLKDVTEIAEQQGHVTLDDLLACDTLPAGYRLCMRKVIRERVLLTDFCSHSRPIIHDESEVRWHGS